MFLHKKNIEEESKFPYLITFLIRRKWIFNHSIIYSNVILIINFGIKKLPFIFLNLFVHLNIYFLFNTFCTTLKIWVKGLKGIFLETKNKNDIYLHIFYKGRIFNGMT